MSGLIALLARGLEPEHLPVRLEHKHPNCTGRWVQQLISGHLYWRCRDCQAIAYPCDTVSEAAIRENQLRVTLRQLADAGDYLKLPEIEEMWQW